MRRYTGKNSGPACVQALSKGALPSGDICKKLDPENKHWRELQRRKAISETEATFKLGDKELRAQRLAEINDVFENNASDYGRKLYLIENCIYGIDIQPIAVQIAKLRFFISLVIDQKAESSSLMNNNKGVRPLPNLETKFVSANTLIGLEKPTSNKKGKVGLGLLENIEIEKKKDELKNLRHKYFTANTRKEKLALQKKDKKLRSEIAKLLENDGWETRVAEQIVAFDPYDQNQSAGWFDKEWMFGMKNGFDIVIGNPPYIDIKGLPKEDVKFFFRIYNTTENRINLYSIFIEKGITLLSHTGVLSYINPNSILVNESYKKIRKYLINGIEKIIKLPDSVFESATVETIILIAKRRSGNNNILGLYFANNDKIDFENMTFSIFKREEWKKDVDCRFNIFGNNTVSKLLEKISRHTSPLGNFVLTSLGITPYDKYKGHTQEQIINRIFHSDRKISNQYVPLISGKNIHPYFITEEVKEFLKYGNWLGAPREKKFFDGPKIIVRQILSGNELKIVAAYSESPKYFTQIGFSLISKNGKKDELKYLVALLNSKLISFYHKMKYLDIEKLVFQKILIANCKLLPVKETNQQKPFVSLVDQILSIKKSAPNSNTAKLEKQIDQMVYKLYVLTEDEIYIMEGNE